jgi:hypothetical protein
MSSRKLPQRADPNLPNKNTCIRCLLESLDDWRSRKDLADIFKAYPSGTISAELSRLVAWGLIEKRPVGYRRTKRANLLLK